MKKSARLFAGDEAFQLTPTGEEGVEMIKAFCGLRTLISNVNLPNKGQIPNLPLGTVVETNAVFSDHSVSPIHSGPMQGAAYALTLPAALAQDDILCAVKSKDASAALRAFAGDPLMVGVTLHDAKLLYRKMLNNTKVYLPGWKLDI